MTAGFRRQAEHELHRGVVVRLTRSTFTAPDGTTFDRDVVHTPDAVAVVPVDRGPDGGWEVVLVGQYRPALDAVVLEIPAGMCDVDGEPSDSTARRELEEEAGYRTGPTELLTAFHPAPGFATHRTEIRLAVGLEPVPRRAHGVEEHWMTVERLALADALARCTDGQITDAKTLIGLLLAAGRLTA